MDTDTTIPSLLTLADAPSKPDEPSKGHPILKIVMGVAVFALLLFLAKRFLSAH